MPQEETEPLLPVPVTQPAPPSPSHSRSKLGARRTTPLSEKRKGKQRATEPDLEAQPLLESPTEEAEPERAYNGAGLSRRGSQRTERPGRARRQGSGVEKGRCVTVIFSGEGVDSSENLEVWVEDGESVGTVKERIRHLRPKLEQASLRLIHSGRLLTDGVLLLSWLRSLEERVKRQAGGMAADMDDMLKEVGLTEESDPDGTGQSQTKAEKEGPGKVWLHCVVGTKVEEEAKGTDEDEPVAPRRRGFDVLLDAGLSAADVAQMRRQFYESRGEEVPEGLEGDTNDEHARALEEQWIEGDMTADTAATSTEGMYSSILHGLLSGFLFSGIPLFFFREIPLPNFFDADHDALEGEAGAASERVAESGVGGDYTSSVVFGKRMKMGIIVGSLLNLAFGALRLLS